MSNYDVGLFPSPREPPRKRLRTVRSRNWMRGRAVVKIITGD